MALVKTSSTTEIPTEAPAAEVPTGFTAVYENSGVFTAELSYEAEAIEGGAPVPVPMTLVSYSVPFQGFVASQKNANTIQITGTATGVFLGSTYDFLMPDGSVQTLQPNTTADFLTLVKWAPPDVKYKVVTHVITANVIDPLLGPSVMTFNLEQDVYWKLIPALQAFRSLLARGRL
jgi:hypothetical protein